MNQLRKDYLLDEFVIVAENRGKRPDDFKSNSGLNPEDNEMHDKNCVFCKGNEHKSGDETGRITPDGYISINIDKNTFKNDGNWIIRWFDNKFSITEEKYDLSMKKDIVLRTDNKFFTYALADGIHEVIVDVAEHNQKLWDKSIDHIHKLLLVINNRITELSSKENINYVTAFKNSGKNAGASINHSHCQISSLNIIPPVIQRKELAVKNYMDENDSCPYCDIINWESDSERQVKESEYFFTFCPYASKFPFEVWIMPKRHVTKLSELVDDELEDLSVQMHYILQKLKELGCDYNFFINYGVENHHLQIIFTPRFGRWAGLELGSGVIVNPMPPEKAAEFYKK